MRAPIFFLVLVVTTATAAPAWAQFIGGGSISGGGGGGTFTGGTLESSLVLDATNTLCSQALSLAFEGDTNTGIQRSAADTIALCVGGATAISLSASSVLLNTGTGLVFEVADSTGNPDLAIVTTTSASGVSLLRTANSPTTGGALRISTNLTQQGTLDDAAASAQVFQISDGISVGTGGTVKKSFYGAGLSSVNEPQTCNCGTSGTPNTVTCDIQSDVVFLTDGDADACTVTLAETTAAAIDKELDHVIVIVISTGGGGAFTIAESAGVVDLDGGASWSGDAVGDNLTLHYLASGSINQFYETARREGL